MGKITWKSTFEDVQKLLENGDETFIQQIKYLNSKQFQTETDKGYRQRNFHFFMAIVLQGVQSTKDKKHILNFLHILYPDPNKKTYENPSTWSRNAGNFVDGKGNNLVTKINDALRLIPKDTEMDVFRTGD